MIVSVREFKNHFSQYLHQVQKGKQITVTSHRLPIAKLSPIARSSDQNMQTLLQQEGIHWNGKKPKGGKNRPHLKGKNASDYVLEDRR